jgi:hypothetical protein
MTSESDLDEEAVAAGEPCGAPVHRLLGVGLGLMAHSSPEDGAAGNV